MVNGNLTTYQSAKETGNCQLMPKLFESQKIFHTVLFLHHQMHYIFQLAEKVTPESPPLQLKEATTIIFLLKGKGEQRPEYQRYIKERHNTHTGKPRDDNFLLSFC